MPFDDARLAQQIGSLVLNLWRLAAEKDDLKTQVASLQSPIPPASLPEAGKV